MHGGMVVFPEMGEESGYYSDVRPTRRTIIVAIIVVIISILTRLSIVTISLRNQNCSRHRQTSPVIVVRRRN